MLKLHCNNCQKYIREVDPIKAGNLTGEEVCQECASKMDTAIEEIQKLSKRAQFTIQKKADKVVADIEILRNKALKGA
jgi:protein-arginine kinase activator protein McsA